MISQNTMTINQPISSEGAGTETPEARLIAFLETELATLGYELVAIDILNHRERKISIYIDLLQELLQKPNEGVGIEDCVKVTHALDAPLESNPDLLAIFKGTYELEVSSPGIDRPLRKASDYTRFEGEIARITTFRPLTADETGATEYSAKNPKQKNFYGILRGYASDARAVLFGIIAEDGTAKQKTKKNQPKPETLIRFPLSFTLKPKLHFSILNPKP